MKKQKILLAIDLIHLLDYWLNEISTVISLCSYNMCSWNCTFWTLYWHKKSLRNHKENTFYFTFLNQLDLIKILLVWNTNKYQINSKFHRIHIQDTALLFRFIINELLITSLVGLFISPINETGKNIVKRIQKIWSSSKAVILSEKCSELKNKLGGIVTERSLK